MKTWAKYYTSAHSKKHTISEKVDSASPQLFEPPPLLAHLSMNAPEMVNSQPLSNKLTKTEIFGKLIL